MLHQKEMCCAWGSAHDSGSGPAASRVERSAASRCFDLQDECPLIFGDSSCAGFFRHTCVCSRASR
jgi:hypothetical protein